MNTVSVLWSYYKCPAEFDGPISGFEPRGVGGYFRFGPDTICYGRLSSGQPGRSATADLPDASQAIWTDGPPVRLPFDAHEVIENLRWERYVDSSASGRPALPEAVRQVYYLMRPLLPVAFRRHLQRVHLRGWEQLEFPVWPVDATVERIHKRLLVLAMKALGVAEVPFIWFWPEGLSSCAIMTHDVESSSGVRMCSRVMDIDDAFGIRSSFQLVPEKRYVLPLGFLEMLRERKFEINIHDLNHDGHLFADHDEFLRRAARINAYAKIYGARGFRSAVMYRNAEWYGALECSYDMSVPNVAHLDPQRGGCCTVMPFFVGDIVELPVTTVQDYSLFHILGDYSIDLWKRQFGLIGVEHGLATFLTHPDYLVSRRASETYKSLLAYLCELRSAGKVWIALPGDVDTWWRERSHLKLACEGGRWRIEGAGSGRARIAYAKLAGDSVAYSVQPSHVP